MKKLLLIPLFIITICSCNKKEYKCSCISYSNMKNTTSYSVRESSVAEAVETCKWNYKSSTGLSNSEIHCSVN